MPELTEEQLNTKISEAVKAATDPLKQENEAIVTKNKELLNEKKQLAEKIKTFDGVDINQIKKLQSAFENSEEAKLLAEGKIDELVNKRVEKEKIKLEEKIIEVTKELETTKVERTNIQNKFNQKEIDSAISKAALNEKVLPSAIDDIQRKAREIFSVDTDGTVVARDKEGNIRKIGDKVLNAENFIKSLKETSPHYWPNSQSAKLRGEASDDAALEAANKGDVAAYIELRKKQKQG